jgi:hypothetical protein
MPDPGDVDDVAAARETNPFARMLHTFLQTSYAIDSGHSTQHLLQLSRSFFQMSVLVFPGLY